MTSEYIIRIWQGKNGRFYVKGYWWNMGWKSISRVCSSYKEACELLDKENES